MNSPLKHHNKKGFTAPELIVVIVLLGIALVPIMKNIVRMLPTTTNARNITIATFLAMQVMEDYRSKLLCTSTAVTCPRPTDNQQTLQDPWTWANWDKTAAAFSSPFDKFKYTVSASAETATETGKKFSPYPTPGDIGSKRQATTYRKLRDIQVTVWYDSNTNSSLDAFEDKVILESKVAKRIQNFSGSAVTAPNNCPQF